MTTPIDRRTLFSACISCAQHNLCSDFRRSAGVSPVQRADPILTTAFQPLQRPRNGRLLINVTARANTTPFPSPLCLKEVSASFQLSRSFTAVSSLRPACKILTSTRILPCRRVMSTTKDAALQSDITKMKRQPDGSFNRAPSSFRNTIEQGGKFAPEKGTSFHVGIFGRA